MVDDRRKVVGLRISAKAIHITNLAECARRYGANKKTKVVYGTVVEHISQKNNPTSNRITNIIVGDYDFGDGVIKRASLNIRSVKLCDPIVVPEIPESPVQPVDGNEDIERVVEAEIVEDNDDAIPIELPVNEDIAEDDPPIEPVAPTVAPTVNPVPPVTLAAEVDENDPAVVVHGAQWFDDNAATLRTLKSWHCNPLEFEIKNTRGDNFRAGDDWGQRLSRLDYL